MQKFIAFSAPTFPLQRGNVTVKSGSWMHRELCSTFYRRLQIAKRIYVHLFLPFFDDKKLLGKQKTLHCVQFCLRFPLQRLPNLHRIPFLCDTHASSQQIKCSEVFMTVSLMQRAERMEMEKWSCSRGGIIRILINGKTWMKIRNQLHKYQQSSRKGSSFCELIFLSSNFRFFIHNFSSQISNFISCSL